MLRAELSALYMYRLNFCLFFISRCKQANIGSIVLSLVSLTPVNNLSAVSLTPVNSFSVVSLLFWLFMTGINDTRGKCYRRCQRDRWINYHLWQRHQPLIFVTDFQWSTVSLISARSTTPVINVLPISMTPLITENPWKRLIAGVVYTTDKHSNMIISANFRKKSKRS